MTTYTIEHKDGIFILDHIIEKVKEKSYYELIFNNKIVMSGTITPEEQLKKEIEETQHQIRLASCKSRKAGLQAKLNMLLKELNDE